MSAATDDATAAAFARGFHAAPPQRPPAGDWATWLVLAGRGFGKTRTGADWIDRLADEQPGVHIALVAPTHHDARTVMVEGESGIREHSPGVEYQPWRRRLHWPRTGATATLYSAEEPDSLRGPQFHYAWADEAARWGSRGPQVLANLRMSLRLGQRPRLLMTTTPLPLDWLKALSVAGGVVTTRGRTFDNRFNLPDAFVADLEQHYGGTRLGRQELDGEFIEDREGGLWSRALLDACRTTDVPELVRVLVGVDPPGGQGPSADACGIVVVGLGSDGIAYVVADRSVQGQSPTGWAMVVSKAAADFGVDLVVAEGNVGWAMVQSNLLAVDSDLNVRIVHATAGKVARAEPVSALYERGKVRHVGGLAPLEDQLCGLGVNGDYAGPGRSPDRADALVWALTELMLRRAGRGEPGIRRI